VFAVVYSFNVLNSFLNKISGVSLKTNLNSNNLTIKTFNTISYKSLFLLNNFSDIKNGSIFYCVYKNNFNYSNLLYYFSAVKYSNALKLLGSKLLVNNNLNFKFEQKNSKNVSFLFASSSSISNKFNKVNFIETLFNINHFSKSLSTIYSNYNSKFNLTSQYKIKYSVSDFFKNLNANTLNYMNVLFLRKNKVFNKGRYSRNRQNYRTGVYWCLYVNVVAVVGIYFWFYRFNMNFGYLWWLMYAFIVSMFFSKAVSFNLFNLKVLAYQIWKSFIWFFGIINTVLVEVLAGLNHFLKLLKAWF